MENNLKVAAIQMISSSNYIQNLQDAAALIAQAATQGAQLVILPEFFISISDSKDFNLLAESLGNGRIQTQLSDIARNNKIYLVAGTIPILAPQINKYYNTCIVYNNTGAKICHYHKIHLFKFNNGEYNFDEGKQFIPGNQVITFEIEGFNFGLSICYDLRFPEFFRQMAGVDAIILPAAFTYQTGLAHWEVLLRARAIENQCYLIASAQGGNHSNGRHTFGHSMIIDPWGKIEGVLAKGAGIVMGNINRQVITKIRTQLPALQQAMIEQTHKGTGE